MKHFILPIKDSNAKVPAQNLNIGQQINALSFLEFLKNADSSLIIWR